MDITDGSAFYLTSLVSKAVTALQAVLLDDNMFLYAVENNDLSSWVKGS